MSTAFALITTVPKEEKNVLKGLSAYPEIKKIWEVYGEYDIVAKIEIDTIDQLNLLVINKLRQVQGINKTITLLAFDQL